MKLNKILGFVLIGGLVLSSCKTKSGDAQEVSNDKKETIVKASEHKTAELNWLTMEEVEIAVKKDPRPILVDVYTKWCGPCKLLDRNTFTDPEVQKVFSEKFHIVKFDAEGKDDIVFKGQTYGNPNYQEGKRGRNSPHQLASFFQVRGYPTMAIYDANFNSIGKLVGYKKPTQLLPELEKYSN